MRHTQATPFAFQLDNSNNFYIFLTTRGEDIRQAVHTLPARGGESIVFCVAY